VKEMTAYVKKSNAKKGIDTQLERRPDAAVVATVGRVQG
jgi:hypothetical protein